MGPCRRSVASQPGGLPASCAQKPGKLGRARRGEDTGPLLASVVFPTKWASPFPLLCAAQELSLAGSSHQAVAIIKPRDEKAPEPQWGCGVKDAAGDGLSCSESVLVISASVGTWKGPRCFLPLVLSADPWLPPTPGPPHLPRLTLWFTRRPLSLLHTRLPHALACRDWRACPRTSGLHRGGESGQLCSSLRLLPLLCCSKAV